MSISSHDTSAWDATPTGATTTPPPKPPTPWRSRLLAGTTLVAVALGSGATGAALVDGDAPATALSSVVTTPAAAGSAPAEQLAKVAAAVSPSVVSLAVSGADGSGEGSGIVLRSDGTILTNNHVVEAAASGGAIAVKFSTGRTTEAELIGRDPGTDLAVVRAKGVSDLVAASLAPADSAHVGDTVLAIGSPLGLDGSVSAGIVSALHRPVRLGGGRPDRFGRPGPSGTLADAIQTDAPINPGNSGGALVDSQGRVIGINTAIATLGEGAGQSGNIGVGFAIPIAQAAEVADALLRGETPVHAVLGVQLADSATGEGAVLGSVTAAGPAAEAGLQAGDVVTALGERPVSDATELAAAVRSYRPGDTVEVSFVRGGESRTAAATLGSATS